MIKKNHWSGEPLYGEPCGWSSERILGSALRERSGLFERGGEDASVYIGTEATLREAGTRA